MDRKKHIINFLIIIIIGAIAIYFSIGNDLEKSIEALKNVNPFWISVSIVLMFGYYILDGMIVYLFGKSYNNNYKYQKGFSNAISGTFFNGITPFASGGQFAQVYIFKMQGISPANASSILLMIFIVYQSVLVCYTGLIMIFRFDFYNNIYSGFFSLAILGFVINTAVITGLFLGAKSQRMQNFFCGSIVRILNKIHIVKNYEETKNKISHQLENFRKELNVLQKNKSLLIKTAVLNILKLTIIYSIPFFIAKSLNISVDISSFVDFIGICSFVYLITSFVPIPGASGGSEGVFYLLFHQILGGGVTTTLLLWRFVTYYLGLIIGGLIFASNKDIKRLEK